MTGSSRLIVEYAGSWALVAAGARSERPGLLRSFHQRSREDRSGLLTPYRPSETRRGSAGPNSKSESGPGLGSLRLVASAVGVTSDHRRPDHHGLTLTPSSHAVPCRLPAWLHSVLMFAAAITMPPNFSVSSTKTKNCGRSAFRKGSLADQPLKFTIIGGLTTAAGSHHRSGRCASP
jgi:hypothetical protein